MATQIDNLRVQFDRMTTAEKGRYVNDLQGKLHRFQGSQQAEYSAFLNECIQKHNAELRGGSQPWPPTPPVQQKVYSQTPPASRAPVQNPQPTQYQSPHGYQPPHSYQPPHGSYQQYSQQGFIGEVYSKSFGFLFNKPVLLWGLSLIYTLLTTLAVIFSFFPILWLPVVLALELGMKNVYLCGYRGQSISSAQLFEGFRKGFLHNAGGMAWANLWILIWSFIPIVGPIMVIVKSYSYRFVPYILLNEPNIIATEALKKSIAQTNGYKGKMFCVDLIVILFVIVFMAIFVFLMRIPFVGPALFGIYCVILTVFLPLLMGTLSAACYDKISKENPIRWP